MMTSTQDPKIEKAQKEVLKYYPLVTWLMWLFGIPVLGGIACVVLSVVLTDAETAGRVITACAGVALVTTGFGGFFKQYTDRKELISTVIGFRDSWKRISGSAPIAICDQAPLSDDADKKVVKDIALFDMEASSSTDQAFGILHDRVFKDAILSLALEHSGWSFGQYFQPITFVTLRDVGTIYDSKGRKLHGKTFGNFIDIEAPEVSLYSIPEEPSIITIEKSVGLIIHELKHVVLKKINPSWGEDDHHTLMGE